MHQVITTTAASVYIDDQGLLHIVSNGTSSNKETLNETFAAARTLIEQPIPTLFDARKWPMGGSDFWVAFIDALPSVVSAGAILIDPGASSALGGFPKAVNRLMVPFEVFTSDVEAVEFLLRFVQPLGDIDQEE